MVCAMQSPSFYRKLSAAPTRHNILALPISAAMISLNASKLATIPPLS
jgi:hypothetical protein